MPRVLEWNGYRFFFFSNEGSPLEPCHIHIRKGAKTAKFWLVPEVRLAKAYDMTSRELKTLEEQVILHKDTIKEKWNEYFNL